jgi:muramidase (phage lysozyme)
MVATHLGPLLEKFAAFVEQNTPAILGAIDQLVSRFAAWLNNPETGKAFVASVKSVADSLVWVSNNLDTIKTGVEVIAGLFALKWAGGIVSSIGAVTEAFGVVGVGGAAGIGLLGALGLVIWLSVEIVRHWSEIKQAGAELADSVGKSFDRVSKTMSDWWTGKHDPNDLPKPGETPSYPTQPAIPAPQQYLPQGGAPGGAWARPPGAIQKQSATGGYLPGGVTRASYGGGPLGGVGGGGGGVAAIGPSEFWDSMARAVAKGFEDAWDHITGIGGGGGGVGGGGGGGFQQASFRVPAPPAGGPSPNIGPGGRTPGALSPGAISSDVTPEGRALLANIAGGESGGDASILYGGGHFSDTSKFPEWAGKMGPAGISHAAGRYQFQPATWAAASKGAGVSDFTPASQDKAAWWLAQHDYRQRTGRDLGADLKDPSKASAIGAALGPTWTSANPGKWASGLQDKLKGAPVAAAPPVTVPPPQAPNGAVDVNITHKNPPPNSAVTASGSGAVNVAPVRVEHQNMADI